MRGHRGRAYLIVDAVAVVVSGVGMGRIPVVVGNRILIMLRGAAMPGSSQVGWAPLAEGRSDNCQRLGPAVHAGGRGRGITGPFGASGWASSVPVCVRCFVCRHRGLVGDRYPRTCEGRRGLHTGGELVAVVGDVDLNASEV